MMNLNGGILIGALLGVLVLSSGAQANTQTNQATSQPNSANTNGQIAEQFSTESKTSTPATYEVQVPKKGYVRPEGNANPWAGGDTHNELRAFFGEKSN